MKLLSSQSQGTLRVSWMYWWNLNNKSRSHSPMCLNCTSVWEHYITRRYYCLHIMNIVAANIDCRTFRRSPSLSGCCPAQFRWGGRSHRPGCHWNYPRDLASGSGRSAAWPQKCPATSCRWWWSGWSLDAWSIGGGREGVRYNLHCCVLSKSPCKEYIVTSK